MKITLILLTLIMTTGLFAMGRNNMGLDSLEEKDFSYITNTTRADIHVTKGNNINIEVDATPRFQQRLRFEMRQDRLIIRTRGAVIRGGTNPRIYITLPQLEGFTNTGSGNFMVEDPFSAARFEMTQTGSGNSKVIVEATEMDISITGSGEGEVAISGDSANIRLTGSGDLKISGFLDNLDLRQTGSGDVDGRDLTTAQANIMITGSGDCDVRVEESLWGKITGSGDITYYGSPQIEDFQATGSGRLRSRD